MEAILFDMDGTILDSRTGIERSIRYALQCMGITVPAKETLVQYIGPPLHETFSELLGSAPHTLERAVSLYRERFAEEGMYEAEVYAGVFKLLEDICASGSSLYIATAKPAEFARMMIDHFGLAQFFKEVYGSQLDGHLSNKAELVRHVLREEKLFHGDVLMVGDRVQDIFGAQVNYVKAIGVTYGYGSEEELRTAGADWLCRTPAEVLEAVQEYASQRA